jgi:predicted DNA-binding transcriptional regulator AlpA
MNHQDIHTALTGRKATNSVASPSARPVEKLLLSAVESAELIGVSLSTFHRMRPRLPEPVVIGPRSQRWRRADLLAWVQTLNSLATLKISGTIRGGGNLRCGGSPADSAPRTTDTEERRGVCLPADPSNPREAVQ